MTALPTIGSINYPTHEELRDGFLRTLKYDLSTVGIAVNVLPGSEPYFRADSWARRAVIAFANNRIRYEDMSPLYAKGDSLILIASVYGIAPRPASKSTGYNTIKTTGTVTIPAGYEAIAPNGELYTTVIANVGVANLAQVELISTNTGASTVLAAGVKLTWTSSSVGGLLPMSTVSAGGIDGGRDTDSEDTLRARLLDRLRNPAIADNVARVRQLAEEATAAVSKAYVYMAVRGPASLDVAVVSEDGDRTLSNANVNIVASAFTALPGHASINTTSVVAEPVNVVLLGTLPAPQESGGEGGGWYDGTPWPQGTPSAGVNDGKVTAYSAPTATVRTTTSPVVGQRIGVWDSTNEEMNEYTIASVGGVSGAYTITVQGLDGTSGFKTSPHNAYVSAGAVHLGSYATTFLGLMQKLGPGEKTASTDILPHGRRQPQVSKDDPRDLDNRLLGKLQEAHTELEVTYGLRLDAGSGSTRTSPSVPVNTLLPPRILTLSKFAIWKA